jgi:2-hydroxycyclohexanecarboxyl-CoA dehydrogenase
MFDLSGRVALVTGAGQNVGAEIARLFAAQGAAVAVNDFFGERAQAVADAIRDAGGQAMGVEADITDLDDVREMIAAVETSIGPVDILVNNAGNAGNASDPWNLVPFHETSPESWASWIDVNLYGVLNCCHCVAGGMADRGWGRIITIVSDAGRTGEALMAVYCAAKAGAAGFSRSIAKELAPKGVTANAIALGTLGPPDGDPAIVERLARHYPVGRIGSPPDIAPAALWLASDEAAWVTGQTIPVNGGYATS